MADAPAANEDPCSVVLLATDGSDFSAGTERVGLEMAQRHRSRLYVLQLVTGGEEAAQEEQAAAAHLAEFQARCAAQGVECQTLLRPSQGDIPEAIVAVAREVGARMLVMGRRGQRGMARLMVGDATAKVLDQAECSVLVVPRLVNYWSHGILLVLEDEPQTDNDAAALAAFELAGIAGLPLTVLLVAEEGDDNAERRDSNQAVNRLVAMAKLREVEAEGMVQSGDIDELILEVARQRAVDLIVCEPRDRSMMERLFNLNNILTLIGQAHCPVMVVK